MQPEKQPTQKVPSKYSKRPIWQWILIYVVIAAIVYAAVYLIFFRKSGTSTTGGSLGY